MTDEQRNLALAKVLGIDVAESACSTHGVWNGSWDPHTSAAACLDLRKRLSERGFTIYIVWEVDCGVLTCECELRKADAKAIADDPDELRACAIAASRALKLEGAGP